MVKALALLVLAAGIASAEPDPARDPAERGLAAMRAHDLVRAEALTRAAIVAAQTPEVLGAALFNLGAIQEARGDRAGAIQSYIASIGARPHRAARQRLEVLAPDLAQLFEPFAPRAMAGPIASLDDPCGAALPADACSCTDPRTWLRTGRHGLTGAMHALWIGNVPCQRGTLLVAVQLADGWYVGAVDPEDTNLMHCGAPDYSVTGATMHGAVATFEYRGTTSCFHHDSDWTWREHGIVAIGIGPSGKPSIVPAIAIDHASVTWKTDGTFDLEGALQSDTYGYYDDRENRRGWHRPAFP